MVKFQMRQSYLQSKRSRGFNLSREFNSNPGYPANIGCKRYPIRTEPDNNIVNRLLQNMTVDRLMFETQSREIDA